MFFLNQPTSPTGVPERRSQVTHPEIQDAHDLGRWGHGGHGEKRCQLVTTAMGKPSGYVKIAIENGHL